jgi:Cof subfamily protein (haloacid dehalogenase superfamily)
MIKLFLTDLDGTLLNDEREVSKKDISALLSLRKNGIITVAATGRSYYSFKRLKIDYLFDYLIFSCGSGIMRLEDQFTLKDFCISTNESESIFDELLNNKLNFHLQRKIPNEHTFFYSINDPLTLTADFNDRIRLYGDTVLGRISNSPKCDVNNFIVFLPQSQYEYYEELKLRFSDFSVIKATSPLNNESIWVEIYAKDVSKGAAMSLLLSKLKVELPEVIGVGNDYNDLEFLELLPHSYVVKNSPNDLKARFKVTSSNNNSGVAEIIKTLKL